MMMTNKKIAKLFSLLAQLMEIHEESPFKIRTYQNAYISVRRQTEEVYEMSFEKLNTIPGIGKTLVARIQEIQVSGTMAELEALLDKTPEGIRDMLQIRGLGAKKVRMLWKEHGFTNLSELLSACRENRLIQIKGFGNKMQETIRKGIEFYRATKGKFLLSHGLRLAERLIHDFSAFDIPVFPIGDLMTHELVLEQLEFVTVVSVEELEESGVVRIVEVQEQWVTVDYEEYSLTIYSDVEEAGQFSIDHQKDILHEVVVELEDEENGPKFSLSPMMWKHPKALEIDMDDLISANDIKGVIHNHSTYSDGAHSVLEMARAAKEKGYQYLVMSDHSKSAFYANGLTEERVVQQWKEIDKINQGLEGFHVFKSIESDILSDGSLDYDDDFLEGFDLVIASVHAHLNMDEVKATNRLIKAIEHPATRILGHLTGRLLLGREGYPVNHLAVIQACAENNVSIELNANPHRLDIDFKWIDKAMENDVLISINPDAHHVDGIDDIRYGVIAAQKGGLIRSKCLNIKSQEEFLEWIS